MNNTTKHIEMKCPYCKLTHQVRGQIRIRCVCDKVLQVVKKHDGTRDLKVIVGGEKA